MSHSPSVSCSAAACIAAALIVATAPAVASAPHTLERVQVTATRSDEPALDVPIAVTVIGHEEILRQAPQTVVDVLHGEPGTYVQQTTPGQGVVIIRGLKGSEVLHLVDGFRLNNAFFRNAPNQYLALVDPLNLERVEAVRGPMSTLYGSDAMGGVVQFFTPEPRFTGAQWDSRGLLRARHSSADRSDHTRAAFALGREGFGLSGGISHQQVGGRRIGSGERLPYTDYSQRSGDLKLLLQPAGGHELQLSLQASEQPKTPRHDALVPGFGQSTAESDEFWFMPQQREFAQLRYRYRQPLIFADSIELQLGQQKIVDARTTRDHAAPHRDREHNASTLRGFTAQADKALAGAHRLSWGVEYYTDTIDSSRERIRLDTGAVSARPSRYPDGSRMDSSALFVSDDWQLTERWNVLGGVRYSRFKIDLPAQDGQIGVHLRPDDTNGQLGLAFAASDALRVVGNIGRGFRAPNVFDLGTFGDRPSNRFNIPNPDLKSETVTTLDLGLKYAGRALEYEVMAFRSNYRDKITSILTGAKTDSGRDIVQSQNATRLRLWGLESGLRGWLNDGATELYATATLTRGDEELDARRYAADRVPPVFGKLGLRHTLDERWEIEGWSLYAARQDRLSPRDASDARINPAGTAGWATLNARLGWKVSQDLSLQLLLENTADLRYREHGSGLDALGRNVSLSLDWTF